LGSKNSSSRMGFDSPATASTSKSRVLGGYSADKKRRSRDAHGEILRYARGMQCDYSHRPAVEIIQLSFPSCLQQICRQPYRKNVRTERSSEAVLTFSIFCPQDDARFAPRISEYQVTSASLSSRTFPGQIPATRYRNTWGLDVPRVRSEEVEHLLHVLASDKRGSLLSRVSSTPQSRILAHSVSSVA